MPDDPQTTDTTPADDASKADDGGTQTFDAAYVKKLRDEAASYRTKVRELEPLAKKAQELEEAGRSDLEKLTARAEQAERQRTEIEGRALRLEVAFEKGLTPAQAKRLVGGNREELEADADEILRDFPAIKPDGRPRGDADQGVRSKAVASTPRQADLDQIEADLKAASRR